MRKKFIAGNWKMSNGPKFASEFTINFGSQLLKSEKTINAIEKNELEVAIFPPSISIFNVVSQKEKINLPIKIGAQNMHWEKNGAYTGEISADMVYESGCDYIIIGHSERRSLFHESEEVLNKKVLSAIKANLKVVFCIGEQLEDRETGNTLNVIQEQLLKGLSKVPAEVISENIIIAYEPVWAIGSGKTADVEEVQEICSSIRSVVSTSYSSVEASEILILYGGSVNQENISSFLNKEDVDGVLVGGASLSPDSFYNIVNSAVLKN